MACDGAGDVNVFLTPRVTYPGELPAPNPHPQTSSLLTFADMVIALDSRGNSSSAVQSFDYNSQFDNKLKADHTYASLGDSRVTTRSQTLKTASCSSPSTCRSRSRSIDIASSGICHQADSSLTYFGTVDVTTNSSQNVCQTDESLVPEKDQTFPVKTHRRKGRHRSQKKVILDDQLSDCDDCDRIVKRSSSVENVGQPIQTDSDIPESSEWPQLSKRHTPRKSSSFEEVNHEMTSRRGVVQRGGSSGQLHRLVNDTIEFPCWPRKADHTYATATWDGTAASHNLFEQEMHQDFEIDSKISRSDNQHQEMEVTETYILPVDVRHSDFENYSRLTPAVLVQNIPDSGSSKCIPTNQKDDHTYVKHNSNFVPTFAGPPESISMSVPNFSFATFPRQKTRDDHTYFHSGMIRRGSGSTAGKEWTSSQSVSDLPTKKDQQLPGTNANFSLQSVSTIKDHTYSTSS